MVKLSLIQKISRYYSCQDTTYYKNNFIIISLYSNYASTADGFRRFKFPSDDDPDFKYYSATISRLYFEKAQKEFEILQKLRQKMNNAPPKNI